MMPKRKREDAEEIDPINLIGDRAIRIKASRLKVKVDNGNKDLKNAIQLAKGFERQKLSRRQKQAEQKPHTLLRLREEVIVVKELEASKTAKNYLLKQLVRTRRIKESPAFVALYGNDVTIEPPKSAAEGNVLGRLFKSNPVKEALPGILKGIRDVLGLNGQEKQANSALRVSGEGNDGVKTIDESSKDDFEGFSEDDEKLNLINVQRTLLQGISLEGISDSEVDDRDTSEAEDEDENDNEQLNACDNNIAASSDEYSSQVGNGDEDSSLLSDDDGHGKKHDISLRQTSRTSKATISQDKLSTTAFLPSLSMGGYYSGSESASDIDVDYDRGRGPAIAQPRKNRRGQRERQKIAALKYGQNAKHLAKQNANGMKQPPGREGGWDARRGAVASGISDRSGRNVRLRGKARFAAGPTGANGDAVNMDKVRGKSAQGKKSETSLHPSWEAARKKKLDSGNAAFTGQKIVFD